MRAQVRPRRSQVPRPRSGILAPLAATLGLGASALMYPTSAPVADRREANYRRPSSIIVRKPLKNQHKFLVADFTRRLSSIRIDDRFVGFSWVSDATNLWVGNDA